MADRPSKTRREKAEGIVLTEEDDRILDAVWDRMGRGLRERGRRRCAKKATLEILVLARRRDELRRAILEKLDR